MPQVRDVWRALTAPDQVSKAFMRANVPSPPTMKANFSVCGHGPD